MKALTSLATVGCLVITGCSAPPVAPAPAPAAAIQAPSGQLPDEVRPISYQVDLVIDPRREEFSGRTSIEIEILHEIAGIWLHGRELAVSDATLSRDGITRQLTWKQHTADGTARISDGANIRPGRARLDFRYAAPFGRSLDGLYKVLEDGKSYAFTQFEPIAARKAFPAFDEPRYKTPFRITLSAPEDMTAIGNMPEVSRLQLEGGLVLHTFEITPPLPTYLLAFAVGTLDVVETLGVPPNYVRTRQLPLRGVAAAGKGMQLDYALLHTGALLGILEDYFGIPYPYPKLDIIAVPDFAAGAMENPGAITFRESLLLLDEDSPVTQRRRFTMVMAHELAHMWFGDLVTMPWWNDIWLNEAFATWMATKAVMRWDPQQKADLSALARLRAAMREDALQSSRRVRQPVTSDRDIRSAFDGITYRKGGGVLNMVESYVGENTFRAGIRDYLRRHAEGSATSDDLVAALSRATRSDLAPVFDSFLNQQGLPLVDVELRCDSDRPTLTLGQSRYTLAGSELASTAVWSIPVCARYQAAGSMHRQCFLLRDLQQDFPLETRACPDWLLPNADYKGYYHWRVSGPAYTALLDAQAELGTLDAMALADSVIAVFEAGTTPLADTLSRLRHIAISERPQVSTSARGPLAFLSEYVVKDATSRVWLQEYAAALYRQAPAERVFDAAYMYGVKDDSQRLYLVEIAEFRALHAGDTALLAGAAEVTRRWLAASSGERQRMLHPDVVPLALNLAARSNDAQLFDVLLAEFRGSRSALLRGRLLDSLARFSAPDLARRARQLALDDDLRRNEIMAVLLEHVKVPENRADAWAWLVTNFDALVARIPPHHTASLSRMGDRNCTREDAGRLQAFMAPRAGQFPGGSRTLAKSVEAVELCAARAALYRTQLPAYAGR